MNKTTNYNLNQWDADDRVLRTDFNADNARIDAALTAKGNCQIVTGSYVGTGTCGEGNPCALTFDRRPMMIFQAVNIYEKYNLVQMYYIMMRGQTLFGARFSGNANHISWTDRGVSWYGSNAKEQFNEAGVTYQYIALLA